tara:strand:- start:1011 stop:2042 length:1032 start_codon:yes stop_codon:yes gene_type:complete
MRRFLVVSLLLTTQANLCLGETRAVSQESAGQSVRAMTKHTVDKKVTEGFLFVENRYVSLPYRVGFDENNVFINDIPLDSVVLKSLVTEQSLQNGRWLQQGFRRLYLHLTTGGTVVLYGDAPVLLLANSESSNLLKTLIHNSALESLANTGLAGDIQLPGESSYWKRFADGFECPQELRIRVGEVLEKERAVEERNMAELAARKNLDSSSYPLTVFGMVLVVIAFGNLLSNEAPLDIQSSESPVMERRVKIFLMLIAAFSVLDLIWTLLASRANALTELNPIGSQLIHNPIGLLAFKTLVTVGVIGILFVLRGHRVAQRGAWWACLICTLVTVRWLTFNSMFA